VQVAGRGYRDGVHNLEVMLESLEWRLETGDTERWASYGGENFFYLSVLGGRGLSLETNWVRLSATS